MTESIQGEVGRLIARQAQRPVVADYIHKLEQENAHLRAENAILYRKAYLTIRLPKWMRRR